MPSRPVILRFKERYGWLSWGEERPDARETGPHRGALEAMARRRARLLWAYYKVIKEREGVGA